MSTNISHCSFLNNSLHLARKYARVCYLFREAKDNVQGQASEHISTLNGDYSDYCNVRSFENWGIFSDIPQF